jgi:hypothetical protein
MIAPSSIVSLISFVARFHVIPDAVIPTSRSPPHDKPSNQVFNSLIEAGVWNIPFALRSLSVIPEVLHDAVKTTLAVSALTVATVIPVLRAPVIKVATVVVHPNHL